MSYESITTAADLFFQFLETSGTTAQNDGTGANGTFVGTPTLGGSGVGATLTPSTDYVSLSGLTSGSFSLFVAAIEFSGVDPDQYRHLFGFTSSTTSERLQLTFDNLNRLVVFFRGANSSTLQLNTTFTPSIDTRDGGDHTLIVAATSSSLEIYVDGVAQSFTYGQQNTGGSLTFPVNPAIGGYNQDPAIGVGAGTLTLKRFLFHRGASWSSQDRDDWIAGPVTSPEGTVTITSPSSGDVNRRGGLDLEFTYDDTDQTGFLVEASVESDFSSIWYSLSTTETSIPIGDNLLDSKTYYIRVTPTNGGGSGTASSTVTVNTEASPLSITFSGGRGNPVLTASSLVGDDFMTFRAYRAEDWNPYLTCDKKYIFVYSWDHETPSAIYWGKGNSLNLSDFQEVGVVLQDSDVSGYHSTETPQLILNLDDPSRPVWLYYHAQEDGSPYHQKTRLVSSAGGGSLDSISWTDEGTVLETSGLLFGGTQVVHTGYAHVVKISSDSWVCYSRANVSGQFQTAYWTSSDGKAWTLVTHYEPLSAVDGDGDWSLSNWGGQFKFDGSYWYPLKRGDENGNRFFAISERNEQGYPSGVTYRLDLTPIGVGQETDPASIQMDCSLYDTSGRFLIEPEDGLVHLYVTRNDPNNDNDSIFHGTIDVRQGLKSVAAGTQTTTLDTTQVVDGDFKLVAKSNRVGGDRVDSRNVSVLNS